jgi:nucleoside permease NupC
MHRRLESFSFFVHNIYFLVERRARCFDFRAVFRAIATACLCGFPAASSVRMFSLTVSRLFPLRSGIIRPFHIERILNPLKAKSTK